MNAARKRKFRRLLFILAVLAVVSGLILYALRQNINLFYTPAQIAKGEASVRQTIRLGGMVMKGSILRAPDGLSVQFKVTDFKQAITVHYHGILPDLFREGQGVVVLGKLSSHGYLQATEVLAKHDANYMPREVKVALTAPAQWRKSS